MEGLALDVYNHEIWRSCRLILSRSLSGSCPKTFSIAFRTITSTWLRVPFTASRRSAHKYYYSTQFSSQFDWLLLLLMLNFLIFWKRKQHNWSSTQWWLSQSGLKAKGPAIDLAVTSPLAPSSLRLAEPCEWYAVTNMVCISRTHAGYEPCWQKLGASLAMWNFSQKPSLMLQSDYIGSVQCEWRALNPSSTLPCLHQTRWNACSRPSETDCPLSKIEMLGVPLDLFVAPFVEAKLLGRLDREQGGRFWGHADHPYVLRVSFSLYAQFIPRLCVARGMFAQFVNGCVRKGKRFHGCGLRSFTQQSIFAIFVTAVIKPQASRRRRCAPRASALSTT